MRDVPRSAYITTPIYYINDAPHLGHAYTTVVCDAFARFHRLRARAVRFLTGTDEHGQKAAESARKLGISPRELADRHVERYREAWRLLHVSNDDFIRTTEDRHVRGAQAFWRRIAANGDIYKSSYSGPYCVGCESFYTDSQLVDGRCPESDDHSIDTLSEESYFFRLSKYQDHLLELYHRNPEFVRPESRLNEVISFVEGGLDDLSVSRTKLEWGVPVPGDPGHVMYVWIEALSNYITALGYGSEDEATFRNLWPANLQVVGKDILRFHAVYWPAFLIAAGIEPPEQVLAHGWWLKDQKKMSKSTGNVADPVQLCEWFGADAVRYFLLREIALGADGNYSEEAILDRTNTDLANDLGNTLSRVTRLVARECDGRVPARSLKPGLEDIARDAWAGYVEGFEMGEPQSALRSTWTLLDATNKFLVEHEPWKLAKDPEQRQRLEGVLHEAAEALRHVGMQVLPAMPDAGARLLGALGVAVPERFPDDESAESWGFPADGAPIVHGQALFPRLDKKSFFAGQDTPAAPAARKPSAAPKAPKGPKKPQPAPPPKAEGTISIEDVMKVQLRTAVVTSCRPHPDADRLLVLELDDGSGTSRTICAGVAAYHRPEELQDRTIVVVANLKPRKLRGIPSQGMLLAANWERDGQEQVRVITLPDGTPPGAEVR